jgi:tRNA modification GTPase
MLLLDDTIAAVSTPHGQGGIGIVRLSGPEALPIARALFAPGDVGAWRAPASHRLYYGHIQDPADGRTVDECYWPTWPRPTPTPGRTWWRSTPWRRRGAAARDLALALRHGARPAEPGEFTLRAFPTPAGPGPQAEAVQDVVTARTPAALQMALGQLDGRLSSRVTGLSAADLLGRVGLPGSHHRFWRGGHPAAGHRPALAAAAEPWPTW